MLHRKLAILLLPIIVGFIAIPSISYASDDITGHWAEDNIRPLIEKKIMVGDGNGNFNPDKEIKRAEFAALLVRALNIQPDGSTLSNPFSDVTESEWYYKEVILAYHAGLVNGLGNGKFAPKHTLTRQEMAQMIKNALEYSGVSTDVMEPISFQDKETIKDWALPAVQVLTSMNIITGLPDKNGNLYFKPSGLAKRAEAATVFNKMLAVMDPAPTVEDEPDKEQGDQINKYLVTNYDYDFSIVVDRQTSPKVDGKGQFTASKALTAYFANPSNFTEETPEFFQFLSLSFKDGLDPNEINQQVLANRGILTGKADAFMEAGRKNNVNPLYLIAHALHESGNGTSQLSTGYPVSKVDGKPVEEKKTYNMYGVNAFDSCPLRCGSEYAYKQGWFTPEDAIIGGAAFIADSYIDRGQDTLYKMRWNPVSPGYPQYATHVEWAAIQARQIYQMYEKNNLLDTAGLLFEIPEFLNQPEKTEKPTGDKMFAVDSTLAGTSGKTTGNLNFRVAPGTNQSSMKVLPTGTVFAVVGENGGWLKIVVDGQEGWVSDDYVTLQNALRVIDIGSDSLRIRSQASTDSSVVGQVTSFDLLIGVLDQNGALVKDGDWYKIIFKGSEAWVHGDYVEEL